MTHRLLRRACAASVVSLSFLSLLAAMVLAAVWVGSHFVVESVSWHRRSLAHVSPSGWVYMLDDSGVAGAAHGTLVFRRDRGQWKDPRYILDRRLPLPTEPVLKLRRHRRPARDGPAGGLNLVRPKWTCMGVEYAESGAPPPRGTTFYQSLVLPAWIPFLAIIPPAVPSVLAARRAIVRLRRRRRGLCVTCGYDLRASAGTCPECGAVPGV